MNGAYNEQEGIGWGTIAGYGLAALGIAGGMRMASRSAGRAIGAASDAIKAGIKAGSAGGKAANGTLSGALRRGSGAAEGGYYGIGRLSGQPTSRLSARGSRASRRGATAGIAAVRDGRVANAAKGGKPVESMAQRLKTMEHHQPVAGYGTLGQRAQIGKEMGSVARMNEEASGTIGNLQRNSLDWMEDDATLAWTTAFRDEVLARFSPKKRMDMLINGPRNHYRGMRRPQGEAILERRAAERARRGSPLEKNFLNGTGPAIDSAGTRRAAERARWPSLEENLWNF
jgi:hypothetical protein